MTTHTIMDKTGDTKHTFDTKDVTAVAGAKQRFDDLRVQGFAAYTPGEGGQPGQLVREFDPEADVIFTPALQGG